MAETESVKKKSSSKSSSFLPQKNSLVHQEVAGIHPSQIFIPRDNSLIPQQVPATDPTQVFIPLDNSLISSSDWSIQTKPASDSYSQQDTIASSTLPDNSILSRLIEGMSRYGSHPWLAYPNGHTSVQKSCPECEGNSAMQSQVSDTILGNQSEVISKENIVQQDSKYPEKTVVQLARMLDPNGQECQALLEKIRNIIKDIKKRIGELNENLDNLPEQAPGDDRNPRLSKRGHRRLINELKATLAERKAEYVAKCGQLPDDVRESEDSNNNWFELPNIEWPNPLEWIPPIPIWNPFRQTI